MMRNIKTAEKPKRQSPIIQEGTVVKQVATYPTKMKGSQKAQQNKESAAVLLKS
jgi:hypothetical protein